MTTDLYPKVRRASVGKGSIVGIAKGAGMIEPNMATMLVYLLTDLAIPRASLRRMLPLAVDPSFNCISIDTDTSTSDTVVLLSSGASPAPTKAFAQAPWPRSARSRRRRGPQWRRRPPRRAHRRARGAPRKRWRAPWARR
jgi:N-acetylglutamate synthase/N-acetylornithine aminotransferase